MVPYTGHSFHSNQEAFWKRPPSVSLFQPSPPLRQQVRLPQKPLVSKQFLHLVISIFRMPFPAAVQSKGQVFRLPRQSPEVLDQ